MKRFVAEMMSIFLVMSLLLSGCGQHKHAWVEATCAAPKTCRECGETEGNSLEHTWEKATCSTPMTCSVCGTISGEALGHDISGLSCTQDGVCTRCGETVKSVGHQFSEATCTQPKACSVCGETEGEALGHTSTTGVCTRCGLESYETVSGNGDDVVTDVMVGDGIYRVHFTHNGRSNFIIKSYDADRNKDLLVNEIGRYDGSVLLSGTAPYSFEIDADGAWSYTIERLAKTSDVAFSGKGDYVTELSSEAQSGVWKFAHDGSSNFIVRAYTTDGRDLLINEIGAYEGKKMVEVPAGSNIMFEITADGNWAIAPVE